MSYAMFHGEYLVSHSHPSTLPPTPILPLPFFTHYPLSPSSPLPFPLYQIVMLITRSFYWLKIFGFPFGIIVASIITIYPRYFFTPSPPLPSLLHCISSLPFLPFPSLASCCTLSSPRISCNINVCLVYLLRR